MTWSATRRTSDRLRSGIQFFLMEPLGTFWVFVFRYICIHNLATILHLTSRSDLWMLRMLASYQQRVQQQFSFTSNLSEALNFQSYFLFNKLNMLSREQNFDSQGCCHQNFCPAHYKQHFFLFLSSEASQTSCIWVS